MNIDDNLSSNIIRRLYEEEWGAERTIGPEQEYPLVDLKTLEAADNEQLRRYFKSLELAGWEPETDEQTGAVTSVNKLIGDQRSVITSDFGTGIVEINYPYGNNLLLLRKHNSQILAEAALAAERVGLGLLGYGVQPLSRPSSHLVADKGRYRTLNARFWTTDRLKPNSIDKKLTDVHFHTINAANQTHIRLRGENEAIKAINTLNSLSPIIIAIMGNSPVSEGRINGMSDIRELFWDWVVNIPIDKALRRTGIPRRFFSIDDYIDTIMDFEPVLTARIEDGKLRYMELYGNKSFKEYLSSGESGAYVPGSVPRKELDLGNASAIILAEQINGGINPEVIDLYAHDSFVWYDARLKAEYGTIELRCCAQQPPGEEFVVPALALGIIENISEAGELIKEMPTNVIRDARVDACIRGLSSHYNGEPIISLAADLIAIANNGLVSRGLGEEKLLDPLFDRVKSFYNPANRVIDAFLKHGIQGLLDHTLIKYDY